MHAPLPNASRTETAHLCEDVYPTPGLRKQTVTAGNGNLEMFIEEDEPKKTAAYRCRSRELGGRQEVRAGTSPPSSEGGRRGPGQPCDMPSPRSQIRRPRTEPASSPCWSFKTSGRGRQASDRHHFLGPPQVLMVSREGDPPTPATTGCRTGLRMPQETV